MWRGGRGRGEVGSALANRVGGGGKAGVQRGGAEECAKVDP